MCTLSWKPTPDGYLLYFNRDEQRSRMPASPPVISSRDGVRFIAPTDAARGGAWLLVNAHGISIGVLNYYSSSTVPPSAPRVSRGLLPIACADRAGVAEVVAHCASLPLADYAPFHLVAAGTRAAAVLAWDGRARSVSWLDPAGAMLTSSSHKPETVARARHDLLARWVGDIARATSAQLDAFHRHRGDDPAAGIRMARADACTHSISRITVSGRTRKILFEYEPQPDIALPAPGVTREMPLDMEGAHA